MLFTERSNVLIPVLAYVWASEQTSARSEQTRTSSEQTSTRSEQTSTDALIPVLAYEPEGIALFHPCIQVLVQAQKGPNPGLLKMLAVSIF